MKVRLRLKRMGQHWWIIGYDQPIGPYACTKAGKEEAREDLRGLKQTFENWDDPSYWTSQPIERVK